MSRVKISLVLFAALLAIGCVTVFSHTSFAADPQKASFTVPSSGGKSIPDPKGTGRSCNQFTTTSLTGTVTLYTQCKNANGTFDNTQTITDDSGVPSTTTQTVDANGNVVSNSTTANAYVTSTTDKNTGQTVTTATPSTSGGGGECGGFFTNLLSGSTIGCFFSSLMFQMLNGVTWILGVTGMLLNWIVLKTVFEFGSIIGNSPGILLAWGILRDIANIALLFGFIFMGIAVILDLQSFPAKKAIPRLLIFALLMNFSLFAAEGVIDVSNALTSSIYNQSVSANCDNSTVSTGSTNQTANNQAIDACATGQGIAGQMMQSTGLSSMFAVTPSAGSGAVFIGLILFCAIGTIVFLASSIMLVIRLITLVGLMVTAPIGFAGMAIPPLQKYANMWWNKLFSQAFFAPAMFLCILISLKVVDGVASAANTGTSLGAAVYNANPSTIGIILVFAIAIGFLIGSLKVASGMSASGATFAISKSKWVVTTGFNGASNLASKPFRVTGRNAVGGGSRAIQKRYETYMGKNPNSQIAKFIKNSNLDDGIAATLKKGQDVKFGNKRSLIEKEKHDKERDATFKKAVRGDELAENIKNADDDTKMSQAIKGLNDTQLLELEAVKKEGGKLDLIAKSLSPEAFDKLMKNKDIAPSTVEKMRKARFVEVATTIEAAENSKPSDADYKAKQDAAKKAIEALSEKDFGQLAQTKGKTSEDPASPEISSVIGTQTFGGLASEDKFNKFKGNNDISQVQKQAMQAGRDARVKNGDFVATTVPGMKPEDVTKINADALVWKDPSTGAMPVLDEMDATQLAEIDSKKLSRTQRQEITDYLKSMVASGTPRGKAFESFYNLDVTMQRRWTGISKLTPINPLMPNTPSSQKTGFTSPASLARQQRSIDNKPRPKS